jgi:cystinosin
MNATDTEETFLQTAGTALLGEHTQYQRLDDEDEAGRIANTAAGGTWSDTARLMLAPFTDHTGDIKGVAYGILTLTIVGSIIGFSVPKDEALPTHWYRFISSAIGYTYFLAWSVSFYPQVVLNFRRQTTQGLSADFCLMNCLGFACYTAYTCGFFFSPEIRELYKERYGDDAEITVQSNDVAFAIHALVLSTLWIIQIAWFDGIQAVRPHKTIKYTIYTILFVVTGNLGLVLTEIHTAKFNWLDFLYFLSYIKVGITLVKYMPQVWLNFQRKTTVGWNIWNVLLDFTGGSLSDLQLVLDCTDMGDFSGITGNVAKFALGSISLVFDTIFMLQHYVLYKDAESEGESFPILNEENSQVV